MGRVSSSSTITSSPLEAREAKARIKIVVCVPNYIETIIDTITGIIDVETIIAGLTSGGT